MATALTLPIARLRAAGCRVSTVIGHNPKSAIFRYRITLPKGIPGHYSERFGDALLRTFSGDVLITADGYRRGVKTPRAVVNDYGLSTAAAFRSLADHVENYDQAGSVSRQHYIETGRYLTHTDVEA